ncbi:RNA-binding protein with serine-rich domain 1-A [Colletotrichum chlorophyti]|uniref:RNA-binding protein with serine-rich domain 1-A n=1 Tax=Colletotrichum chlorophyti TaxID=708187 RepID=A0A1Q8S4P2_9PEZI|nr:RNA-binding protein with serine-rich domain 1-A [Colletotrichum chlorophyti]
MASRSRSPSLSRDRYRSRTRSPTPLSDRSRSPVRRRSFESRSPSRSRSPTPRRNGKHRSESRSWSRGRSASPAVRSTKIVVERLTKNINESHLEEIFGQYGRIKDLDLPVNRSSGLNRGTAYILFDHEADAEDAIAHMHEAQIDGAVINVSIVLPRRKVAEAADSRVHLMVAAEEDSTDLLVRMALAEACRRYRRDTDLDQTPTVLVHSHVLPVDPLVQPLRPEEAEADTEAGRGLTPDPARHPLDAEAEVEVTTLTVVGEALAETAMVATIAVEVDHLAVAVTVVAVVVGAAADIDE